MSKTKDNKFFAFTVKRNDIKAPKEADYAYFLKLLSTKGEICDFVYENKTKRGNSTPLHIHGVVEFQRNPFFKSLCPKGYHTHFELITDSKRWLSYINKNSLQTDCHPQTDSDCHLQTDSLDYFRNNYAFNV